MRIAALLLVGLFLITPCFAIDELTTTSVIFDGKSDITAALTTKSPVDKVSFLAKESDKVMTALKYPLSVSDEIKIEKCRYDEKRGTMGYWITAMRGGKEVAVNNPVWVYPPPYLVVTSEVYDARENKITLIVKEDPEAAIKQLLSDYVALVPLGKPTTGTV